MRLSVKSQLALHLRCAIMPQYNKFMILCNSSCCPKIDTYKVSVSQTWISSSTYNFKLKPSHSGFDLIHPPWSTAPHMLLFILCVALFLQTYTVASQKSAHNSSPSSSIKRAIRSVQCRQGNQWCASTGFQVSPLLQRVWCHFGSWNVIVEPAAPWEHRALIAMVCPYHLLSVQTYLREFYADTMPLH